MATATDHQKQFMHLEYDDFVARTNIVDLSKESYRALHNQDIPEPNLQSLLRILHSSLWKYKKWHQCQLKDLDWKTAAQRALSPVNSASSHSVNSVQRVEHMSMPSLSGNVFMPPPARKGLTAEPSESSASTDQPKELQDPRPQESVVVPGRSAPSSSSGRSKISSATRTSMAERTSATVVEQQENVLESVAAIPVVPAASQQATRVLRPRPKTTAAPKRKRKTPMKKLKAPNRFQTGRPKKGSARTDVEKAMLDVVKRLGLSLSQGKENMNKIYKALNIAHKKRYKPRFKSILQKEKARRLSAISLASGQ